MGYLMARNFRSHAVMFEYGWVRSPTESQPSCGAPVQSQVAESKKRLSY